MKPSMSPRPDVATANALSADDLISQTRDVLMNTYTLQPVTLTHGKGAYVWDTEGKQYLDFAAGIAVAALGHAHPKMLEAINEQASKMMIAQASYTTPEKLRLSHNLLDNTCFDKVFFANSGSEVVEATFKLVRKWAHFEKGPECKEIIAFRQSFHGRTFGCASATEKCHVQDYYAPYLPGIQFAEFNNLESVKALISDKTAAIIVEPVQGEGGLKPADPAFLRGLRMLCDEHKIALIFDEIQCGMGRIGTFYAYQSFECCPDCHGEDGTPNPDNKHAVEPDIACMAKGLGGGFPVSALVAREPFASVFVPGDHGSTYGGNPLAMAVGATVTDHLKDESFLKNVRETGAYFVQRLEELKEKSGQIKAIRGMGLMVGVDTVFELKDLIPALQRKGFLATGAGKSTLRLTPPLIIGKAEIDEAIDKLEKTFGELSA